MKYLAFVLFLSACPALSPPPVYPEQDSREHLERVLNATVVLLTEEGRTTCAGVLHNTYVITAFHCVAKVGINTQRVGFRQDLQAGVWTRTREYRVIEQDDVNDIAVLSPEEADSPRGGLPLSPEDPEYGAPVMTVGHPLGWMYTLTRGFVSHPKRVMGGSQLLQISAPVSAGNSGGPVLNEYGEIVGIVSFSLTHLHRGMDLPQPHLAGAVHLDAIRAILGE